MSSEKKLVVVAGPTAIGKTDLAIRLALHYNTHILSADSRQFYQEMNIGTAKPSAEELKTAKHYFINSISVREEYSAGDYETEALSVLNELYITKDVAILAGGSGLFIRAVTEGFDDLPKAPSRLREELNESLSQNGLVPLQRQLEKLDPVYYEQVDINNPQRVIRALEVCLSTGKPFSSFRSNSTTQRPFTTVKIGLTIARELLYERINKRVDSMIDQGLVEEVASLVSYRHLNALNTVGYAEIFDYLDGNISLEAAIEKIKQNTRRFAKRQLTWLRKDSGIRWFAPGQTEEIINYINTGT